MAEPGRTWRYATAQDVPALVALLRAAYRSGQGWTSEARLVEGSRIDAGTLLQVLEKSPMLVVEDDSKLIACCRLEPGDRGVAHFGMFAVDPAHQAAGLGRWLMGQAARVAAERFGAHTVELRVLVQQTALLAWYERLGFVRTGETQPFPGHPEFARPLRDDLRFAVLRKAL